MSFRGAREGACFPVARCNSFLDTDFARVCVMNLCVCVSLFSISSSSAAAFAVVAVVVGAFAAFAPSFDAFIHCY